MEQEDNVYEETTLTEDVAETQESAVAQGREDASAVLGKFKDVNALARAYGALEAEFTRRSQRLKELEKLTDNLQTKDAAAGAEKLRKHAKSRKEETKAFDEFVSLVANTQASGVAESKPDGLEEGVDALDTVEENTGSQTQELCLENEAKEGGRYALTKGSTLTAKPEGEGNAAELDVKLARGEKPFFNRQNGGIGEASVEGEKTFPAVAEYGNTELSSEELYRRARRDEGVRLKIIGEYLASIGKNGAPLTASGVGVPITPSLKAKSIGDAGVMALHYFKQP